MTLRFLDLRAPHLQLSGELSVAIRRVLESGRYVLGSENEEFERAFAEYVGTRHCVGVGSGLDALHLSLRALGVEPGHEVIVPANTYIATWLAVTHSGATPVPVEPDESTYTLDPRRLEDAVTPRTAAVIPVHLYGQPADMAPILEFARRRGLHVLEDAAQAHGACYRGRPVGGLGHAAAWSFYPGKNLGAFGDGGAVTTDNDAVAERLRVLRDNGSEAKYVHTAAGFSSRLDEIQAAVLRVKLRHLDEWNARRRRVAALYLDSLQDLPLALPLVPGWAEPVWHLFVVRSGRREALRRHLAEAGIETHVHYPVPPHLQGAYAALGFGEGKFPITEAIHREVVSLPMGPHLSEVGAARVIDALRSFDG
jgi:dTDP-4-amino-4,6-dideoxygalactose transaminase